MNKAWYLNTVIDERWAYASTFTKEECQTIIELGKSQSNITAYLENGNTNFDVRKSKLCWLDYDKPTGENVWIYQRCTDIVNELNSKFFQYDLTYIEMLQFTIYEGDMSHYSYHIDNLYSGNGSRKLSFSILLSDPSDFTGGDLELLYSSKPTIGVKEQGVATAFPSWMLHRVAPVSSGTRYSLVGWCVGPRFK